MDKLVKSIVGISWAIRVMSSPRSSADDYERT